jgi:cold shock protein
VILPQGYSGSHGFYKKISDLADSPKSLSTGQPIPACESWLTLANRDGISATQLNFWLALAALLTKALIKTLPQRPGCSHRSEHAVRSDQVNAKEVLMATGTVKWFNATKGYGFIQPSDGSKDVFVHVTAVEKAGLRSLNEGQQVTFEVSMERGKPAAINLQVT